MADRASDALLKSFSQEILKGLLTFEPQLFGSGVIRIFKIREEINLEGINEGGNKDKDLCIWVFYWLRMTESSKGLQKYKSFRNFWFVELYRSSMSGRTNKLGLSFYKKCVGQFAISFESLLRFW